MSTPSFTLGIEEEYQTIDPRTYDLRSHIQTEIFEEGKRRMKEKVKTEMHQSVVEVGTGVCRTVAEADLDLRDLRRQMIGLTEENGLLMIAGATHPFADWRVQDISPDERYVQVVEDMQIVARANLIFGLHVHVGIEDRETLIHLMNQMRYFLPHLLAISTNSPFWIGMNTGLKSYRCKVFDRFPRTNIPDTFSSWADFENFVSLLVKTRSIDNAKKIWWDVRPHPVFDTLEVRICDIPLRVEETIAIAALIQATMVKLYRLHAKNQSWRVYSRALLMENKWRASRYGIDGMLIDFGKEREVPERELLLEYLDWVDDVLDELGSRDAVNVVRWILENGTGADRQLRVYEESGHDLKAVVNYMIAETRHGL
ncbi:MAG: carboxylate-amine ligase [Acidobacteria bacterium]|jgi:carboxylate-amine ligase|nr:carboxylate-amine ligase [Acidobacteriota bacterium]